MAASHGWRDVHAVPAAGDASPTPTAGGPAIRAPRPGGTPPEESSPVAMEVDQGVRASPCIAPDEVVEALTEMQVAQLNKVEAASDTEASESGPELAPHLAAADRISIVSSEYHDCLPATAQKGLPAKIRH